VSVTVVAVAYAQHYEELRRCLHSCGEYSRCGEGQSPVLCLFIPLLLVVHSSMI
jgi:hypothetical protein